MSARLTTFPWRQTLNFNFKLLKPLLHTKTIDRLGSLIKINVMLV